MKKTVKKTLYRVSNWKEYNESLKRRGDIELWIDKDAMKSWQAVSEGRPGHQKEYSDTAIEALLMIRKVFHLKLRQLEGFAASVFRLMGTGLKVPDYTTICRRGGKLDVKIPRMKKGKIHAILDSTGLKVYGEGEWKVRQHGYSKRRTWKKLHISIDGDGEIRAVELTDNNVDDAAKAGDLLREDRDCLESVNGDGGYDREKVYRQLDGKVRALIPPQKNARIKKHGNCKGPPHKRDKNLRSIRKKGRKRWKKESGYHKRSLVETAMFRFKTVFGGRLMARSEQNQVAEARIMASALNRMSALGMPKSYRAA